MKHRLAALIGMAGFSALVLAALVWSGSRIAADTPPADTTAGRISFQIATGSTSGTFFPVGEAIAGLISHPPGVNRCEAANVCGPAGLIVSARTSEGQYLLSVEVPQKDGSKKTFNVWLNDKLRYDAVKVGDSFDVGPYLIK